MRLSAVTVLACSTVLSAQDPLLNVGVAQKPGDPVNSALSALPGLPYATLIDVAGGPNLQLGETLFLGVAGAGIGTAVVLDAGVMPPSGLRVSSTPTVAATPTGIPLFLQSVVLDARAPNGLFASSDGESTAFYSSGTVLVEKLIDPTAQGYTGEFDAAVRGRLQGEPVRQRIQSLVPDQGSPFSQPIQNPLNPFGARSQMVYRAVDLDAKGEEELVVGLGWLPFGGSVESDRFDRLTIALAHSHIVPDYSINLFSSLPQFPNSGLTSSFAGNIKPGETPTQVFDGGYSIAPSAVQPDGFLPYPPLAQPFRYNGRDSLLVDISTTPSASATGRNGAQVYLMVNTSPQPNSRAVRGGSATNPVNPFAATTATTMDNSYHVLQVVLADVRSVAVSPWRKAPTALPNYHTPTVAASVPAGGALLVEYRGAQDDRGTGATPWSTRVDVADAQPYLQMRLTMDGNPATGSVPSVDAIVVPIN